MRLGADILDRVLTLNLESTQRGPMSTSGPLSTIVAFQEVV
jgi:hypothetical protein